MMEIKYKNQNKFIVEIFRQNLPFFLFGLGQIISVLAFIYPNQNKIHFLQSSIARGTSGCFISYFIMLHNKQPMTGRVLTDREIYRPLFLRNCLIIVHANIFALSQLYLSQPVVQTINCMGPVFTFLTDYFRNKVEINRVQSYGIIGVVLGSVLIANQKGITNLFEFSSFREKNVEIDHEDFQNEGMKFAIVLLLLVAVIFWGIAQTLVKNFSVIDSSVINMHFAAMYMISNGIGYPLFVDKPVEILSIMKTIIFCGIPSTIAALCMIKAAKMTQQTGVLTLMTFVTVIIGEFLSLFRYNEDLQLISLLGMIIIISGIGTVLVQVNIQNTM